MTPSSGHIDIGPLDTDSERDRRGNVHGLVFFDIDGANIQPPSGRA